MANGRSKQKRIESLQLIMLAFNDGLDASKFIQTGQLAESCVGKPLELSDELEHRIAEEIERTRRENPDLPSVSAIR